MKLSPVHVLTLAMTLCVGACSTAPQTKQLGSSEAPPNAESTASEKYKEEKAALDRAAAIGGISAYDEFIRRYPGSAWTQTATYQRDRLALEEAKRIGTPDAFREFLNRYPASDWANQARYYLQYGVPSDGKAPDQAPGPAR